MNECHNRSIDTVNKIKELVTASEVVVNHKYGLKETVTNKTTVFFFGNSTQGIPLEWETGERKGVFYNLMNVPLSIQRLNGWCRSGVEIQHSIHVAIIRLVNCNRINWLFVAIIHILYIWKNARPVVCTVWVDNKGLCIIYWLSMYWWR